MKAVLNTNPQTNRQLLKNSLALLRMGYRTLLPLSFLLALLLLLPRLLTFGSQASLIDFAQPSITPQFSLFLILIDIVAWFLVIILFWRIENIAHHHHEKWRQDVKIGFHKILTVLLAIIIQNLFIVLVLFSFIGLLLILHNFNFLVLTSSVGSFTLAILSIGQFILLLYVYTLFIFLIPIIATENKNILQAIKHAFLLSWNHWWRIFSLQIIPWLCYLLLIIALKFVFSVHFKIFLETQFAFLSFLLHLCLFCFFIPWVAALLYVQLHDLELRFALRPKRVQKAKRKRG